MSFWNLIKILSHLSQSGDPLKSVMMHLLGKKNIDCKYHDSCLLGFLYFKILNMYFVYPATLYQFCLILWSRGVNKAKMMTSQCIWTLDKCRRLLRKIDRIQLWFIMGFFLNHVFNFRIHRHFWCLNNVLKSIQDRDILL